MARDRTERAGPVPSDGPLTEVDHLDEPVDLSEALVSGDFSRCELVEPVFRQCRLDHTQFTGSTLRFGRFIDCVFTDSDLSGTVLEECLLSRVEFRNCRASGLQAPLGRFNDVGIFSTKLEGANFRMSSWERAEISESDLAESDLYGAKMPISRMLGCDLSRSDFSKADLAGSHLSGSNLDGIRGATSLRKIVISSDQIIPLALAIFASQRIAVSDQLATS